MWNDTDIPLAYLITFRCYGTWLHGDERGSIDRFHNVYKSPLIPPDRKWHRHNSQNLRHKPVLLNAEQRNSVEKAIHQTCAKRNWILEAVNVRTNHVHTVVKIGTKSPDSALNAFKANATRQMRAAGYWNASNSPWSDKGSKRFLWSERSVGLAIDYVINGQGEDLPNFD
jgi:REP element-mobilizing transposase RayT